MDRSKQKKPKNPKKSKKKPGASSTSPTLDRHASLSLPSDAPPQRNPASSSPSAPASTLPPRLQATLLKSSILSYARRHPLNTEHSEEFSEQQLQRYLDDVGAFARRKGLADSTVKDYVNEAKKLISASTPQDTEKKRKREDSDHGDAQEDPDSQGDSKATSAQKPAINGASAPHGEKSKSKSKAKHELKMKTLPGTTLPSSQAPPEPSLKRKRSLSVSNKAKSTNVTATTPKPPKATAFSAHTPEALAGGSEKQLKRLRKLERKRKKQRKLGVEQDLPNRGSKGSKALSLDSAHIPEPLSGGSKKQLKRSRKLERKREKQRKLGVEQDLPNVGSECSNTLSLDLPPSVDVRGSFSSPGSNTKDMKSALFRDMKTDFSSEAALEEDEEESDFKRPSKKKRRLEGKTRVQDQQDELVNFLPQGTPRPNHEDLHAHVAMKVDATLAQSNHEEDSSASEAEEVTEEEKGAVSEVDHEEMKPSGSIEPAAMPPQLDSEEDVSTLETEGENRSDPADPGSREKSDPEEDPSVSETGGGEEEKSAVPETDHREVTPYGAIELEATPPQSDPEDDSDSEVDEQEKGAVPEPGDGPDAKSEADSSETSKSESADESKEASEQESDAGDKAPMRTAHSAAFSPRRTGTKLSHAHPHNQRSQATSDERFTQPYKPGSIVLKYGPQPWATEPPVQKQPEKPKQGTMASPTSYEPGPMLRNPQPPHLPVEYSVPKPPEKRKSALEKLKEGLEPDSEPEESDSSDEESPNVLKENESTPKTIAPPPPQLSFPARHSAQKLPDMPRLATFPQKSESESEPDSSQSNSDSEPESDSKRSEPRTSRAVEGPSQAGSAIESQSPTSSDPSVASDQADVESPHRSEYGKDSLNPTQTPLSESNSESEEEGDNASQASPRPSVTHSASKGARSNAAVSAPPLDTMIVDRNGSKDSPGSQRIPKSIPMNVNDAKPAIGHFVCVRVCTKPKVSEEDEAARNAGRDIDEDNKGEDSPYDTSTGHDDQDIDERMSDSEDPQEVYDRAPGDSKPAQSKFNGFSSKRSANEAESSEVVTISSNGSSSEEDVEKDAEADNYQVSESGNSPSRRFRRIGGAEPLIKTDANRTPAPFGGARRTNGGGAFTSGSMAIDTAPPTKTTRTGPLSQGFVSGIPKPTPNQKIPRYRRGTSEDYPWIATPQERRDVSDKLIESSARRPKTATVLQPWNNIPQVDGTTAAHVPSTPPVMEAAEKDNVSEPGSRTSSYDNEPKGFLRPDGSISARTRRTGLRSQHFNPPSGSQKPKRSLAGTVSSLPFPSVKASRFGLIQEELAHKPFQLLVAVIFLNKTKGTHAIPRFREFVARYPGPDEVAHANLMDVKLFLRPLGLQNGRAQILIDLAKQWLVDSPRAGHRHRTMNYPTKGAQRDIKPFEILGDDDPRVAAFEIAHLPGCGAYALDSWRIFCRDPLRGVALDWNGAGVGDVGFEPEWKRVRPTDKELRAFLRWMWLKEGWVWNPKTGERRLASTEEARSAAERWRWDQERGEEVWVDGGNADETRAAADGSDVDMADADADALLSGFPQNGKAGRVVTTKATSPTPFQGAVEDDDETGSVFDADDEDEDEAAADQLVQGANARPSQTERPSATRPSQRQSRPSATARQPSPISTQHAVIRKEDDGATAEEATNSSDAASDSDEHEDGATTADENGDNSSYGGVGGVARLFRRAERGAKHFFRGVVEETPQPESPARKERWRAAADDNEEEAMVDSSPIGYRDDGDDDDEMEEADEHGNARQSTDREDNSDDDGAEGSSGFAARDRAGMGGKETACVLM